MILDNIFLGANVDIDSTTSINNIKILDGVKVAKRCSLFGSSDNILEIGRNSYVGMNTIINGYKAKIVIGDNVSIAQSVNIMSDSGPNASKEMQKFFPLEVGNVQIGNHCWIGANSIIMPNVVLGEFCVVAANSFVNDSFEPYSVIGGNPARLLKKLR
ncbi:DapH/DapD/GlmU-related protein [Acinetobacter bereziniae]|uniref:acyltransferase n=1 Tax=Acinetobacter bereziniae TaxID=106648 RepID=UPI0039C1FFD4